MGELAIKYQLLKVDLEVLAPITMLIKHHHGNKSIRQRTLSWFTVICPKLKTSTAASKTELDCDEVLAIRWQSSIGGSEC